MKIAIASMVSTLVLLPLDAEGPQDAGRVPIPTAPEIAAARAAPVLAGLRQAKEALKAWRAAAAEGPDVDVAELKPVNQELEALVEELKALHARAKARAHARAPQSPPRPAPSPEEELRSGRAREIARAWIDDVRALGDGAGERREKAFRAMREALQGSDLAASLAALQTLSAVGDVEYDKPAWRPLILPFAQDARDGHGPLVAAAFSALLAADPRPEDLALVHSAWLRFPDALHDDMLHDLKSFGGGRIEGRSEEIALELLATRDHNPNMQFGGLWGAQVGPRLEARVLEIARGTDEELRHAAIYFGLSTFANKSKAVVDALVATLSDPDHNNSGRALWGLGQGVPDELHGEVAAALVDLHNSRSDRETRERCIRLVRQYGGPAYEAKLKH